MPRRTSIGLPSPLNPHQPTVKKSEYDWLFRPTPSLRSQRRDLTSTLHIFALERQSPIPIYGLNISGLIPIDADHDVYKILRQISVVTSPINLLNDDLDEYQLGALCDAFEICLDIFEEACKQEGELNRLAQIYKEEGNHGMLQCVMNESKYLGSETQIAVAKGVDGIFMESLAWKKNYVRADVLKALWCWIGLVIDLVYYRRRQQELSDLDDTF